MSDDRGACLITQPQRSRVSKDHAHDLADIIAEITTVTVLTANLPADAPIRSDHEIVEFSSAGTGERVLVEAVRFALNQLRLCLAIARREEGTVLFFGTTSYLLPVVCARLLGKRVLVLPRGDVPLSLRLRWEEQLPSPLPRLLAGLVAALERAGYRLADGVVSYTPAMAEQLGLSRDARRLYANGARFVDTEQFDVHRPFEQREQVVGFVGRLDVEKRIPELAEAARRLPDEITFVFVGDGSYREQLERELAEEIEAGSVEVVGWVDREDVPEQLNRFRLQVVPSHPTEGLPTAILEGMACGTPAYATPVSGVPDVVREGETGFLMDDERGAAIAAEIEGILDREDLAEISQTCRETITEEYSFEAAVRRWRTILDPD
ncbi:glycosyltransferase [Halovenus sp. WSH3]|uniref:Glycosyltransferase n=1 Tax=Halovenus carboxidivorans TaxID=2692199 RepID=A0A6B0T4S8_9EURY|nr:glycosyltransferase family 4 protein [Halovenus carboxidivorans]MXR53064.1 glycosyltransferase [Halovenus carboxidivorans]